MSKIEVRHEAMHLVVVLGYSQKEAGKILGVSQKTVCNWAKKYQWKATIEKTASIRITLNNFLRHVANAAPHNYNDIKSLAANYINHLMGKTNKTDVRISKNKK